MEVGRYCQFAPAGNLDLWSSQRRAGLTGPCLTGFGSLSAVRPLKDVHYATLRSVTMRPGLLTLECRSDYNYSQWLDVLAIPLCTLPKSMRTSRP